MSEDNNIVLPEVFVACSSSSLENAKNFVKNFEAKMEKENKRFCTFNIWDDRIKNNEATILGILSSASNKSDFLLAILPEEDLNNNATLRLNSVFEFGLFFGRFRMEMERCFVMTSLTVVNMREILSDTSGWLMKYYRKNENDFYFSNSNPKEFEDWYNEIKKRIHDNGFFTGRNPLRAIPVSKFFLWESVSTEEDPNPFAKLTEKSEIVINSNSPAEFGKMQDKSPTAINASKIVCNVAKHNVKYIYLLIDSEEIKKYIDGIMLLFRESLLYYENLITESYKEESIEFKNNTVNRNKLITDIMTSTTSLFSEEINFYFRPNESPFEYCIHNFNCYFDNSTKNNTKCYLRKTVNDKNKSNDKNVSDTYFIEMHSGDENADVIKDFQRIKKTSINPFDLKFYESTDIYTIDFLNKFRDSFDKQFVKFIFNVNDKKHYPKDYKYLNYDYKDIYINLIKGYEEKEIKTNKAKSVEPNILVKLLRVNMS